MQFVESVRTFEQIKLLADARRMEIVRLLMASPATLTQLAEKLHQSPAWVRHHILALEKGRLVEISEVRKTGKVTEKFYRATGGAFLLQEIVLPKGKKNTIIFSGSHDLAMEEIARHLSRYLRLLSLPVGSLDGLVNLRQGMCQISGSHILSMNGEYNVPTVRHLFPDRAVEVVTLAHRTQGFILGKGNPKGIRTLEDLSRGDVRIINRNPGSGTRLWFDMELKKCGIDPAHLRGYDQQVKTHTEAAQQINRKAADVSIGLQAAAHKNDLDFIPLFEERYDLILPVEYEEMLLPILDTLQTAKFRRDLSSLTGYNPRHSGEQILI